ncbi:hypothetical protein AGABI1DRAFT_96330 [Agaricus bisporus var. burnettii JB137-S8]|uniref:Uncharacterized protein n=1 Tax=Agaricus bisporus var. burnettii (strain JB137-S8 / ATCC MYA-4627 / FGSC 10392) TaxID=597362 RepID=K5WR78_AGABU|nr:uncharacterized protein AGABI1DRAFT_96330 [Agaricus bisporus var. burnettii JB137-S8]EKM73253.1 hypothetical protein AGABI1DRAFT_96330 [Agaricus bisporus var. burnettii JB137-S8]
MGGWGGGGGVGCAGFAFFDFLGVMSMSADGDRGRGVAVPEGVGGGGVDSNARGGGSTEPMIFASCSLKEPMPATEDVLYPSRSRRLMRTCAARSIHLFQNYLKGAMTRSPYFSSPLTRSKLYEQKKKKKEEKVRI